jgi:UDP-N-acetylmuramate--alanine ligase
VIDDYAHHPTEIKATLAAVHEYSDGDIFCVFQPHTYTRTLELLDDFSTAFRNADYVLVLDIYAAREPDTGLIHSRTLTDKINGVSRNATYLDSFEAAEDYLKLNARSGDIVITMGAGDVYKIGDRLIQKLHQK